MRDRPDHDDHDEEPGRDPDEEPQGTVRLTGVTELVGFALVGLVVGWAVRPLSYRMSFSAPGVSLATIGTLAFVALVIGGSAYLTRRTVRRDRASLPSHQAVNRLVLGKASALVGALFVGGYLGYAVAQVGASEPDAHTRLWRSLVAALAAAAIVTAALMLERACRVPPEDS